MLALGLGSAPAHAARGSSPAVAAARAAFAGRHYAEAESLATRALAPDPRGHAPSAADSAALIDMLVMARWRNDRETLPDTAPLAERSMAIRSRAPGRDSLDFASSLETRAYARGAANDNPGASVLVAEARRLRERASPPSDPDRIRLLHLQGAFRFRSNAPREAVPLFTLAIEALERYGDSSHTDLPRAYMVRGSARYSLADYAGSASDLERAVEKFDASGSPPARDLLYALNVQSIVQGRLDDLAGGEASARRAVALATSELGPLHPQTGYAYRALGYSRVLRGDHTGAREAYEKALAVLRVARGEDDAYTIESRRLLATQANKCGDFALAYATADSLIAKLAAAARPDSQQLSNATLTKAFAADGMGRTREALMLYRRALEIGARAYPPVSEDMALLHRNVGGCALELGDAVLADSMLTIALRLYVGSLGPAHSEVAPALAGLALARQAHGDLAAADTLMARALGIMTARLGRTHPNVAGLWTNRARLDADLGRDSAAVAAALIAARSAREQFALVAGGLSERDALRFAFTHAGALPVALTLAAEGRLRDPALREATWDEVIRSRTQVLDEMARRSRRSGDPATDSLRAALREARERLAAEVVRGPARRDSAAYAVALAERRGAADRLEVALGRASARDGREAGVAAAGYADVRSALPADAALVAFVHFPSGWSRSHTSGLSVILGARETYVAFVLAPGRRTPAVVPLGPAVPVDSLVRAWSAAVARSADGTAERERDARAVGAALRARIWDPIAPLVAGAALALVVPDGALQLVPFAALPARGGGYLAESGPTLHALTSERDVLPASDAPGRGLLALGDPAFDGAPLVAAAVTRDADRGTRSNCRALRDVRFEALPGTRAEVDSVTALWRETRREDGAERLVGDAATAHAFAEHAPGHRVVHAATHGFFLDATCAAADAPGSRGVGGWSAWDAPVAPAPKAIAPADSATWVPSTVPTENPLLLSGLVFAGANDPAAGADDGVLTADEIASLDLSGVEWAVLSACRTGAGEVASGEGVFGLRRAFRVAGARTVITSPWSVGDQSARDWMTALYRERLLNHGTTAGAVRAAGLERLRARRATGRSTSPLYWSPFQAAGDWR